MTDCNFHQRHLKAGDGTYFYKPEYFLSKEEVDVAGKRIEKVYRCSSHLYKLKVPDATLDQCDKSYTAVSANTSHSDASVKLPGGFIHIDLKKFGGTQKMH